MEFRPIKFFCPTAIGLIATIRGPLKTIRGLFWTLMGLIDTLWYSSKPDVLQHLSPKCMEISGGTIDFELCRSSNFGISYFESK